MTKCPRCGSTTLHVDVHQIARVYFYEEEEGEEEHEVLDVFGDIEFDDKSFVQCPGCDWTGRLIECNEGEDK